MPDEIKKDEEEVPVLDIPDEEFEALSLEEYEAKLAENSDSDSDKDEDKKTDDENDTDGDLDPDNDDKDEDKVDSDEDKDKSEENNNPDSDLDLDKDDDKTVDKSEENLDVDSDKKIDKKNEDKDLDYKDSYEQIFAPFRANNRDMQVNSIEEVRRLMQMGANYNKKMAGIKPNLKIIKMLENNNLLDEDKLNFLIDLDKKNPEAIKKLIKDSEVNPLEIDVDEETNYKAKTYTVDDKEVELDQVLEDIKDTKSFDKTIDIVGNKWDVESKEILRENPNVIKIINNHVSEGIYEKISAEVERERMLGNLEGVSDLVAYKQIGDELYKDKGDKTVKNNSTQQTNKKVVKKPTSTSNIVDRKKAASSSKGKVSSKKGNDDFNPLAMSDEEFAKVADSRFT